MSQLGLCRYLVIFIQEDKQHYVDFRLAELESVAELVGVKYKFYESNEYSLQHPLLEIWLENDQVAKNILARSVMIRNIYRIWERANNVMEMVEKLKVADLKEFSNLFEEEKSFAIKIETSGRVLEHEKKLEIIKELAFMPWKGPIRLNAPDVTYGFIILYDFHAGSHLKTDIVLQTYFGNLIGESQRDLPTKYTLKKRQFLSPTATDSKLSLLMANEGQVTKRSLVLDPFVGSGSLLVAATHFGAYCFGTDIDYAMIHGTRNKHIWDNFAQYGLRQPDVCRADQSNPPWHNLKLDAIICDPPYGIRAGAKRVINNGRVPMPADFVHKDDKGHIVQMARYEVQDVMIDLIEFAATFLVVGGKLVFLYPTTREYKDSDLPTHPCLQVTHNSEQYLQGNFCRRLITMNKFTDKTADMKAVVHVADAAHLDLHDKYFKSGSFEKDSNDTVKESDKANKSRKLNSK